MTLNICPSCPFLLFPPALITEHAIWNGVSLWSVWFSCPGCLLNALCAPAYLLPGQREKKVALRLCKHYSATAKTSHVIIATLGPVQSTAPYRLLGRKLVLTWPRPMHAFIDIYAWNAMWYRRTIVNGGGVNGWWYFLRTEFISQRNKYFLARVALALMPLGWVCGCWSHTNFVVIVMLWELI